MATTNQGWTASETFGTTSPVSGAAPTAVDGTDGQPIQDLEAVTLVIVAPSGQTLSGAGSMDCYLLDPSVNLWGRFPLGDFSVGTSGVRVLAFEPADIIGPRRGARLKWVPNGVTFSGGSTGLAVYQLGSGAVVPRRYL